jgi:hypothetical protein
VNDESGIPRDLTVPMLFPRDGVIVTLQDATQGFTLYQLSLDVINALSVTIVILSTSGQTIHELTVRSQ